MQTKSSKGRMWSGRVNSFCLCMVLIVAMALWAAGCGDKTDLGDSSQAGVESEGQAGDSSQTGTDVSVLGEGGTEFFFSVADKEGNETNFEIHTDKETVGEALLELGLIAGEEGEYGLYVKTVNGITVDFDKDGAYWAFYVNGEYAMTGVDSTAVTAGDSYSFRVE